jgi:glutathione S-transferase
MRVEYVDVETAMAYDGLRMVVVGGVPSPWSEGAKGVLHVKDIGWKAVRLAYDDERLKHWIGELSGPVAIYGSERPRAGWAEILLLAERIAPTPALLPADPAERAMVFGLAHELLGEGGLAWTRRLQLVQAGVAGQGGFAPRVAKYLGKKYGYRAEEGANLGPRVTELLGMLAKRLAVQRAVGSQYCVGRSLTAADIYLATTMALFKPLPPEQCDMDPGTRAAFDSCDAALDPSLLEHRDMIYARHLALPLAL